MSKTCAYTNHTILAEALEKWPLEYLEKVVPQLVPIIKELDKRVAAKYEDPNIRILFEAVSNRIGQEGRQFPVTGKQPSSERDAVRLIVEFFGWWRKRRFRWMKRLKS